MQAGAHVAWLLFCQKTTVALIEMATLQMCGLPPYGDHLTLPADWEIIHSFAG